ncbi:methyl-accepting chemotaxis protein [Erythrobacter sp. A6_0]|nr:methyl-accepting chemotaxis protein [Erythrobacter sp. A6_0]MBO9511522.1 methyl-accepting chemotaxis protein [Erythrobacter sp. A6_0]
MLTWFRRHAPMRRKFDIVIGILVALAAVPIVSKILHDGLSTAYLFVHLGQIGVILAVGLWCKKLICDPYVETVERMEAMADGDLHSPVSFTDNRDCVGRMARAMTVFRRNAEKVSEDAENSQRIVSDLGKGLERLAAGDLTYRIDKEFPENFEQLRKDFNGALEALSETMAAITDSANSIGNGSDDIRQASDDLSQRTEQQAASLEETAAAMDQITGIVREAAASAGQANTIVIETRDEAEKSGEVVRNAVYSMNGIERASTEIGAIISVIDGIAFQTNLLALNAGVEAARAGDAGKGFAVVASEVRALAQRSAEAAKDVKEKITASTDQVEHGVALVSQAGEALERIIARITEIANLVGGIASSANEQSTGLQQINTAVSEMDGVTQQNAAMVEQATAAARNLADEARALNEHISHFRTADNNRRSRSTNPVHQLQARASKIARPAPAAPAINPSVTKRAVAGGGAVAAEDDWSEF